MRLNRPATVEGRKASFWAPKVRLSVVPFEEDGVWFLHSSGLHEPIGNGELTTSSDKWWPHQRVLRCLYWHSGKVPGRQLRVPEHLFGILHLLDATGLLLEVEPRGLPYEGNGRFYWKALAPAMQKSEEMRPGVTVDQPVRFQDGRRFLSWEPGAEPLTVFATVQYRNTLPVTVGYRLGDDPVPIANSRPYGREGLMRTLALWRGVTEHYAWERGFADPIEGPELLRDIARHRILDLLGALEILRQRYGPLCGRICTAFVGHDWDVWMVNHVEEQGLLVPVAA